MNAWRERWGQVLQAWRVRDVRRGMYGTLLIAVGSLTPAYLPRNSPWWPIMRWAHLDNAVAKVAFNLLVLAGVALLVQAWFRLRPAGGVAHKTTETWHDLRHWAVLLIWGLPFFLAPPIFSHDAYSYAAQGWMLHNGVDPYQQGPGVLPGGFADQVAWVWRFTPAPYGPLALQVSHLLVDISGYDPYLAALLMRIPAVLGVGLIGLCIPRLATRMRVDPAFAAWFATLNPVLVIDFIGGAHNDALMMGLVVFALFVAHKARWGWLPAAVVIGVAAAIKQPALLAAFALPLIRRPWRTLAPADGGIVVFRALVSLGLATGVFALISVVTGLNFGWYNAVNVPGMVVTVSPFTVVGQGLRLIFDAVGWHGVAEVAVRYSRAVGLGVSAVVLAVGAVTIARRRPIAYLAWSYLAVAICAPALHSWYVLWGGLLLPLARPSAKAIRAAIVATIVLLSYAAVNLSMRNGALALGVAALAAYGFQVWSHERRTQAETELAEKAQAELTSQEESHV